MSVLYFLSGVAVVAIVAVIIFVKVKIARLGADVACSKGYTDDAHAFAMCFWLGAVGWLYVAALPNLIAHRQCYDIIKLLSTGKLKDDT